MFSYLKNNQIINGMLIVSFASVFSNFLSYYLNFLIQSLFPNYGDFSNFAFIMTVILMASLIPGAISSSLSLTVTELNVNKEYKKLTMLYLRMLIIYSVIGLLASALMLVFSEIINQSFKVNNLTYIYLTSVIVFLATINSPILSYLYGLLKFKAYALLIFLGVFLKIVFVVLFFNFGYGFNSILYAFICSLIISFVLGNLFLISRFDFRKNEENVKNIIKKVVFFSLPIFFITTGNNLLSQIDFIVLKAKFSEQLSGQYALLGNIGKIFLFGSLIFLGAMGPQITNSFKSKEKYFEILFFYLKILILIIALGLIILGLFPKQFLDIFIFLSAYIGLNPKSLALYYDIVNFIPLYSLFISLVVLVNFLVIFLVATSTTRIFVGFILSIVLQFSLLNYFANDIFLAVICNIISTSLLLVYLILEVYKKYESFNNSSSL